MEVKQWFSKSMRGIVGGERAWLRWNFISSVCSGAVNNLPSRVVVFIGNFQGLD